MVLYFLSGLLHHSTVTWVPGIHKTKIINHRCILFTLLSTLTVCDLSQPQRSWLFHSFHDIQRVSWCFYCSSPTPPNTTTNTSACRTTETSGAIDLVLQCTFALPECWNCVSFCHHRDSTGPTGPNLPVAPSLKAQLPSHFMLPTGVFDTFSSQHWHLQRQPSTPNTQDQDAQS